MKKPVIIISEMIFPEGLQVLENFGAVHYDRELFMPKNRQALLTALADAEAIIIRNLTQVDEELLASAPNLKIVGRLGVGINNIDLEACRRKGVFVSWGKTLSSTAVAELTMGLLLGLNKPIFAATQDIKNGGWDRQKFMFEELAGRTLGVIGAGDIGSRVMHRARAFGMNLLAYDPYLPATSYAIAELGAKLVDLDTLLGESDYVSLNCPLTNETYHLINPVTLGKMKKGAYLINTARGEVVDETALYDALQAGQLRGAALDVRECEPPVGSPLHALDNVLLTPHVGGGSIEARTRISKMIAEDVVRVLQGQSPLLSIPSDYNFLFKKKR